jgi:hypothetical protein
MFRPRWIAAIKIFCCAIAVTLTVSSVVVGSEGGTGSPRYKLWPPLCNDDVRRWDPGCVQYYGNIICVDMVGGP